MNLGRKCADECEDFRGHEHFGDCAEFCEKCGQTAFDANYDSAPLEFFEPIVTRGMVRPINSIYVNEKAFGRHIFSDLTI